MNTHLHLLEPYVNLYRVWPDARLATAIRNLIDLFISKIYNPQTHHLRLFFDDEWRSLTDGKSFGHDIEASWLLHEAALVLNDMGVMRRVEPVVHSLAQNADFECLFQTSGESPEWWEYAETVVGYLNIWQHFGEDEAFNRALRTWRFIEEHFVDRQQGEWYWSVRLGTFVPNIVADKAGLWKCPYHNSRACLEVLERLK